MNQIFSLRRFWLLIKLDLAEKGKNYLMMGGMLVTLMLVLMLPIFVVRQYSQILVLLHALALFMVVMFGGSLYTSQVFHQYSTPATGIAALMIPASRFEKYLTTLLVNLLFIVPFMVLFVKMHLFSVVYANSRLTTPEYLYNPIPDDVLRYFISLYTIIHGVVFLGSIYFSKFSYIKSAIAFFFTYILVGGLYFWQGYRISSPASKLVTFPFTSWDIFDYPRNEKYIVAFPDNYQYVVYAFPAILLLSLWAISFVRLREKQI